MRGVGSKVERSIIRGGRARDYGRIRIRECARRALDAAPRISHRPFNVKAPHIVLIPTLCLPSRLTVPRPRKPDDRCDLRQNTHGDVDVCSARRELLFYEGRC